MVLSWRHTAIITVTIIAVAYILKKFDFSDVVTHIRRVPYPTLLFALSFVVVNLLFSCIRYHSLMRNLGIRQPIIKSFHDNIISIIGGMVAFNFFGQGLSRTALHAKSEWAPTMAFLTTGIERSSSLIVLLAMALAASIWLFGGISVDFAHNSAPALILVYLGIVFLAVYRMGLRRQDRLSCRKIVKDNFRLFSSVFFFTILILLSMGFAYVSLARSMTRDVMLMDLLAMASVVMLVSSLPISFSGWGIRELSAGYVFAFIGQSSEAGMAMGILIGLMSLAAILGLAIVFIILNKYCSASGNAAKDLPNSVSHELNASMFWLLPISAAVAILFQVLLPTDTGFVNVNLADPLVITGALITLINLLKGKTWRHLFWANWLMKSLVVSSIVIAFGFLHSWFRYGVIIDWALYNRLIGWLVLISYLLTGMMIYFKSSMTGARLICRSFLVACAFLVLINIVLFLTSDFWFLDRKNYWFYSGIYGMAGNPNAFGFQLLIALALGFSGLKLWDRQKRIETEALFLGIVVAGVYLTQSRASFICLVCLFFFFYLLKVPLKKLLPVLGVALIIVAAFYGAIELIEWLADIGLIENHVSSRGFSRFFRNNAISHIQSDRMLSITDGLKMWKDHLLLGAGLGAFIFEQIQKTGVPLVIHSNYLWWLAEFGILGLLSFLTIPLSIFLGLKQDSQKMPSWAGHTLIGILIVMGVTGFVHDMAYQRTFWFFLGLTSANSSFFAERFRSTT